MKRMHQRINTQFCLIGMKEATLFMSQVFLLHFFSFSILFFHSLFPFSFYFRDSIFLLKRVGDWDGWARPVPLIKSQHDFISIQNLPPGVYKVPSFIASIHDLFLLEHLVFSLLSPSFFFFTHHKYKIVQIYS